MMKKLNADALDNCKVIVELISGEKIGPCNYFQTYRDDVFIIEMNNMPVIINFQHVKIITFIPDKT